MDDAQKRAADFNTEQRIRELEHEIVPAQDPARPPPSDGGARRRSNLYELLDVTSEQVRIVELEVEIARLRASLELHHSELEAALIPVGQLSRSLREVHRLRAMLWRLFDHQQRHDPDPQCPVCTGVEAYLEGRTLTEDQQRSSCGRRGSLIVETDHGGGSRGRRVLAHLGPQLRGSAFFWGLRTRSRL